MPPESRPGPDSPPVDELASAEASLGVLQQVLRTIAADDKFTQTPCSEYNVKELTEHLLHSIMVLGGMVGAEFAISEDTDSVEGLVIGAARPALDAWHRHGLEGAVPLGPGSMTAQVAVSVFSIEFLVHAWDYAVAVGCDVEFPDSLCDYVLGLARKLIKPDERSVAGFDDPIAVPDDASALHRLVAFTGRNPARPNAGR
ncbi:TIGR03086 family metal-binding protein [Mycobacterium lacus]|uniref:TIGR03086 family protein n=1 Tax=Mycobacterium lacus TaxID=169765 RepID=A0A1X1XS95_9MYCO|nr:TIGR03086 family metal-binding protein [Mycobacterium lacus]MCV7123398.1 TIGR03086 family protein [Mycobacterium lacus]ORW01651.1 ArsR family transcriptional regulator [Mycobacterium lacus]BBX99164.1 TIGR03086 family protein [Mycobacterium lacus]